MVGENQIQILEGGVGEFPFGDVKSVVLEGKDGGMKEFVQPEHGRRLAGRWLHLN